MVDLQGTRLSHGDRSHIDGERHGDTTVPRDTDPLAVRALTRGLSILWPVRRGPSRMDHRRDGGADRPGAHDRLPHGAHARVHGLPGPRSHDQSLPSRSGDARHVLRRPTTTRASWRPPGPSSSRWCRRRGNRSPWPSRSTGTPSVWTSSTPRALSSGRPPPDGSSATSPRSTARSSPPSSRRRRGRPSWPSPVAQRTPHTVTDQDAIVAELDQIARGRRGLRHRGFLPGHLRGGCPGA